AYDPALVSAWPHVVVIEPHSSGLALSRTMVRAGARVTMLTAPGDEWETHSRGAEHVIASWEPDGEPCLSALERLAAESDELVVLPASDRGSELLAKHPDRVPSHARAFEVTGAGHLALMDKQTADGIARRAGVNVPWTRTVHSLDELDELARALRRGARVRRRGRGGRRPSARATAARRRRDAVVPVRPGRRRRRRRGDRDPARRRQLPAVLRLSQAATGPARLRRDGRRLLGAAAGDDRAGESGARRGRL